jgi:hypothetical protein
MQWHDFLLYAAASDAGGFLAAHTDCALIDR